jgi:hypothetical protein
MSYIGNAPTQIAFQTDTFSGNASTTAFTMSVAPAGTTSMLVAITGVVQDPSTYSVVGTTLTFSAAPPTGTNNISVRYLGIPASGVTTTAYRTVTNFTATAGQTTFSVPSYTVGYIDVYRNGVRLAAADYTATDGTTVVLTNAATLNDSVVTESFYVSSVLNAIPATAGAVNSTYITDSAVTTAKILDANVTQAKLAANVAGNGPAFSAYLSGSPSVTSNTFTKVQFNVKEFDTNSSYDNTTNYRFTPTVAGYYQINAGIAASGVGVTRLIAILYKNGVSYKNGYDTNGAPNKGGVSSLVYLNGSSDYVEIYGYITGTSPIFFGNNDLSNVWVNGVLVRAA